MRTFLAIAIVIVLAVGGIIYFSHAKSSPQTSIDGTTDVGNQNSLDNSKPVDQKTLLGDLRNAQGKANAPVTITEFSDYQCPYCKTANEEMKKVLAKYGDKIRFAYRHFPLQTHPLSRQAAQAAEAAGAQGKFWQMHDKIFDNQDSLTADSFEKFAGEIGLNIDQFRKDVVAQKYVDLVNKDYQDGITLQVQGTPTFYVNGRLVQLSSFSDLYGYIDAALKK